MKIISKGKKPEPNCYEGTCSNCKSVVRFKESEIKTVGMSYNNHQQSIENCPVCNGEHIIIRDYITQ